MCFSSASVQLKHNDMTVLFWLRSALVRVQRAAAEPTAAWTTQQGGHHLRLRLLSLHVSLLAMPLIPTGPS